MGARSRRDAEDWLRLLMCGIPPRTLSRLAALSTRAGDILALTDTELEEQGVTVGERSRLRKPADERAIEASLAAWQQCAMRLITLGEPEYPENLLKTAVPPAGIFVRGEIEPDDRFAVGLVGPRLPTPSGLEMAENLARDFAPMMTVVSGCAVGIDTRAHKVALDSGGRTIGVMGGGLDIDYPAANRELREAIVKNGRGALISIFPPGTPPRKEQFPMRNAILASLCLAVVVVEASDRSGALSTARAALDEGRPVYAVPGDATRRTSVGANALLREGAGVCTCAADVIADLEGMLTGELARARKPAMESAAMASQHIPKRAPAAPTNPLERAVMGLLAQRGRVPNDDLMAALVPAQATTSELAQALLTLELRGNVRQLPGRIYEALG